MPTQPWPSRCPLIAEREPHTAPHSHPAHSLQPHRHPTPAFPYCLSHTSALPHIGTPHQPSPHCLSRTGTLSTGTLHTSTSTIQHPRILAPPHTGTLICPHPRAFALVAQPSPNPGSLGGLGHRGPLVPSALARGQHRPCPQRLLCDCCIEAAKDSRILKLDQRRGGRGQSRLGLSTAALSPRLLGHPSPPCVCWVGVKAASAVGLTKPRNESVGRAQALTMG